MQKIPVIQCIIMENTLIKLTLHDETKKRAHDSQIVRAKENLKLSHGEMRFIFLYIDTGNKIFIYFRMAYVRLSPKIKTQQDLTS